MRALVFSIAALFGLALPVQSQCAGQNLIAALPAAEQSALRAAAGQTPYATGNFWRATRGDTVIHIIGTYHFDDPRHAPTLATLAPILENAQTLLVEAGPEEEAALKAHFAREPDLMINTNGPTLPELLPAADWDRLSKALADRGIPAFMAAKFRPWYLSMVLSIPACDMEAAASAKGLDGQLIDAAMAQGLTVQALEPYDTLFAVFDMMPQADQLAMITSALAMEEKSADMAITLADAYFAQESRLIWEFMRAETLKLPDYTPQRVAEEFATMEQALMITRNRAWITVIEDAAAKGPALVAFGALHLSGDQGVLRLLEQRGFALTLLPLH
jgi:uncharacterized protein